jgi:hypothetical protein
MNKEFWQQFQPITGMHCVEMKDQAQARIVHETQGFSTERLIEYFNEASRRFRMETGATYSKSPQTALMACDPADTESDK